MQCKVRPTILSALKLLCICVCTMCPHPAYCMLRVAGNACKRKDTRAWSKLCEEFDENKMWNMRRCNKWARKSGFALLALSKLCELYVSFSSSAKKSKRKTVLCAPVSMMEKCGCEPGTLIKLFLYLATEGNGGAGCWRRKCFASCICQLPSVAFQLTTPLSLNLRIYRGEGDDKSPDWKWAKINNQSFACKAQHISFFVISELLWQVSLAYGSRQKRWSDCYDDTFRVRCIRTGNGEEISLICFSQVRLLQPRTFICKWKSKNPE